MNFGQMNFDPCVEEFERALNRTELFDDFSWILNSRGLSCLVFA